MSFCTSIEMQTQQVDLTPVPSLAGNTTVYARTAKGEFPVTVKELSRFNPSSVQLWNGTRWMSVIGFRRSYNMTGKREVVLRSGERIACSPDYLWMTQRGGTLTEKLVVGDVISSCPLSQMQDHERRLPVRLSEDFLWLLGLYFASGQKMADSRIVTLPRASSGWSAEGFMKLASAARQFGSTFILNTNPSLGQQVKVMGKALTALLDRYATPGKGLNARCWNLPNAALQKVAEGYFAHTGIYDAKQQRIRLGLLDNDGLERDLRTLASRLNSTCILNLRNLKNANGVFPIMRGEWRWTAPRIQPNEVTAVRQVLSSQSFWSIAINEEHSFALASGVLATSMARFSSYCGQH